jgi:transcriptional regulator with XRE-family HTH domain
MTLKFKSRLKLPDVTVEKINNQLNKSAKLYSGAATRCPKCGKALDLVGNDGFFCKFCGAHIAKKTTKTFEESMKALRKERGWGQAELSEAMGLSVSNVCKIEKGKKEPSVENLAQLSNIYNCSVNVLFGQEAPRIKIEGAVTNQNNLPSLNKKTPILQEDIEGYELDTETIFLCPHCHEEVDLTPMESLTLGLPSYEVMRLRTHGNDGHFCKYCGQAIERPVKINEEKAFNAYSYWIKYTRGKLLTM